MHVCLSTRFPPCLNKHQKWNDGSELLKTLQAHFEGRALIQYTIHLYRPA